MYPSLHLLGPSKTRSRQPSSKTVSQCDPRVSVTNEENNTDNCHVGSPSRILDDREIVLTSGGCYDITWAASSMPSVPVGRRKAPPLTTASEGTRTSPPRGHRGNRSVEKPPQFGHTSKTASSVFDLSNLREALNPLVETRCIAVTSTGRRCQRRVHEASARISHCQQHAALRLSDNASIICSTGEVIKISGM